MKKKMKLEKENVVLDFNDVEELEEKSMYITETTGRVRIFFGVLLKLDDKSKMAVLLYLFSKLNCNQINDKDEPNPDLSEDDDINIFTFSSLGFPENANTVFLQYLVMVYNILTSSKDAYEDNGNVLGIKLDEIDKKIASDFEKLNFNEKLDVFSEIIIRYDNETYFKDKLTILTFDSKSDGYAIAKMIKDYKNQLGK